MCHSYGTSHPTDPPGTGLSLLSSNSARYSIHITFVPGWLTAQSPFVSLRMRLCTHQTHKLSGVAKQSRQEGAGLYDRFASLNGMANVSVAQLFREPVPLVAVSSYAIGQHTKPVPGHLLVTIMHRCIRLLQDHYQCGTTLSHS